MTFWGAKATPSEAAYLDCEDAQGPLQLSQISLLEGHRARVFIEVEGLGRFAVANLDEDRCPNLRLRLSLAQTAKFAVEGDKSVAVSLIGVRNMQPPGGKDDDDDSSTDSTPSDFDASSLLDEFAFSDESGGSSHGGSEKSDGDITEVSDGEAERIMRERREIKKSAGASVPAAPVRAKPLVKVPPEIAALPSLGSDMGTASKKRKSVDTSGTPASESQRNKKVKLAVDGAATNESRSEDAEQSKDPIKVQTLRGGVKYEVLKVGHEVMAINSSRVKVKYEGRLASSGKQFDKGTLSFTVGAGDMIEGFDFGVRGMLLGEQRRIFVPSRLGYKDQRVGGIPPNSDLIFDVTVLEIKNPK